LLLMGIMLGSLLMAVAIPEAFGAHGLLFAGAYVAIQVGRHAFLTFVSADAGTIERERAGRILTWLVAAGILWIAGGLAEGSERAALWVAALAVDYVAPLPTGCRDGHDSPARRGTCRPRTSPSVSSCS